MMFSNLKYFLPSILSLIFLYCVWIGYDWVFLPVLAAGNVLNATHKEFSEPEIRRLLQFYYDSYSARIFKIINALILTGVFYAVFFFWNERSNSISATVGLGFLLGIVSGCFLLTLAHDLLHGHSRTERSLATVLLLTVGIPHYASDHVLGHHRYVGLQYDSTTARLGQHFYHYFVNSLAGRWWHAYIRPYPLPAAVQRKVRAGNFGLLGLNILLVFMLVYWTKNPALALLLYLVQNAVANLLYELINYIQHYGLERGDNEAIGAQHAWNCYFRYTNYILFLLPLHSQHHLHAKAGETPPVMGPRMPYLYFVMIFMALLPPWWFAKMNPLVRQLRSQNSFQKTYKRSPARIISKYV